VIEVGRAWWKERQETSHRSHGEKAGGIAASSVGKWRSVRTIAQPQPDSCGSRVKRKAEQVKIVPEEEKTKAKAEFR